MYVRVLSVAVKACRSAYVGFEFSEGEVEHLIPGKNYFVANHFIDCVEFCAPFVRE